MQNFVIFLPWNISWNVSEIFFKNLRCFFPALCIVHCNKVSKPVEGKYLLLCMNSIMYLLLTWYTLIMFLKVLSHLILKVKSLMKYFKKRSRNVLKFSWNFLIFQSEIFHRASLVTPQVHRRHSATAATCCVVRADRWSLFTTLVGEAHLVVLSPVAWCRSVTAGQTSDGQRTDRRRLQRTNI